MTFLDNATRPMSAAFIGAVISAVLAISGGAWQHYSNQKSLDERFSALTAEFADLVSQRFHLYQYGLRSARGAIVAGGVKDTKRQTFIEYFQTRDQFVEFPGARGTGFIERVQPGDLAQFLATARADGAPAFAVRELTPNTGERFIIKFIYPLKGNEGATGLDIASENNRRTAAIEAARTGMVRLTAPITLVQASGQSNHGFLILLPIYRIDASLDTPEERQAANVGWSYSPLVVSEVLRDLGPRREEIAFAITDIGDGTEFYKSPGFDSSQTSAQRQIDVFGRTWHIGFHARPAFFQQYAAIQPMPLAAGIGVVGLLLTFALYGWLRNREQMWQLRREEEAFAYKIVDAAPQALLVVDDAGIIVRANSYCGQVFGWTSQELTGRSIDDLVPDRLRDAHRAHRMSYDYQPRDMGDRIELEALRADGTCIPIVARLSPLLIGGRKLVVAGVTDVTAEREAIRVLNASRQRWQEMANSLPQLVWTCDAAGACDFLSEQWVAYTGIPTAQLLGAGWLDQVHPDDRQAVIDAWTKSVGSKTSLVVEFRIRRADGAYRLFFTRAEPIIDQSGNVERWIGSNTDIEDRHIAEMKVRALLEELEQRVALRTAELNVALRDLQNVLDAVPSMIAYWDSDMKNRFANRAYERWFGVKAEWLKGRHIKELLGEELFAKNQPYIEGALRGEPQEFERDLRGPDGVMRSSQAHYLPDIADGKVHGFYVLVFDVSTIKESERAQREAREAAEDATRAKSAFLTSMSHELRTPMNSILGFTDLLIGQHFGTLNDKQLEHAKRIRHSGEHLLKLMDSVLELSKIEAGRISISLEPVNVVATVKAVVANLDVLAKKFKVEIRVRNLASENTYVKADITRLTQVLINLGSNAIKYNRPGGWVEFSTSITPDGNMKIMVADNGLGIAKDRQGGAFQPFNRMGSEKGKIEGSGIGLALVRNYVELMGGRVNFESTENQGSQFWVELRTVAAIEADDLQSGTAEHSGAVSATGRRLRVLYVEDNEINRLLFKGYIETFDAIDLMEAEDGPLGLEIARKEHPDLIFLDINLPGMNGYDVLQEIRADQDISRTKVIALTANAMSGDSERGLDAGFDHYLAKPVRLQQLAELLKRAQL